MAQVEKKEGCPALLGVFLHDTRRVFGVLQSDAPMLHRFGSGDMRVLYPSPFESL